MPVEMCADLLFRRGKEPEIDSVSEGTCDGAGRERRSVEKSAQAAGLSPSSAMPCGSSPGGRVPPAACASRPGPADCAR